MKQEEVLFFDVRARHCVAEVFFNGLPTTTLGTGHAVRVSVPVLHHAVEGRNRVEVFVKRPTTEVPVDVDAAPAPEVICRLTWFRNGTMADSDSEGRTMAEVLIDTRDDWNRAHFTETDLALAGARPSWVDADTLSMTSDLFDEAETHVRALASAIQRGAVDTVESLMNPYLDDYARAYPEMGRAGLAKIHQRWLRHFVDIGGRTQIANRSEWQPRIVGNGKLLDLRRKDGEPVLTLIESEDSEVPYPFLFAKRGSLAWAAR